jgi:hypothetical protein
LDTRVLVSEQGLFFPIRIGKGKLTLNSPDIAIQAKPGQTYPALYKAEKGTIRTLLIGPQDLKGSVLERDIEYLLSMGFTRDRNDIPYAGEEIMDRKYEHAHRPWRH